MFNTALSRRCIEVEVEHKTTANFVAPTLLKRFAIDGEPKPIGIDNGPDFSPTT